MPHLMAELSEHKESLWRLAASPTVWAAHFLVSYVTVALWCAKVVGRDGLLGDARLLIVVYTVLALTGIGAVGWAGFRRHTYGFGTAPHDFDSAEDRHRFLGFATLLLSALSVVGVLYVALTVVFIQTCH